MRITKLEAENVKRLTAVSITPSGNAIIIGGDNEAGKSSVLDSIMYALGGAGTHPPKPVREGEKKATIKVRLGDDAGTELTVTKTISRKGTVQLVVEDAEGRPQKSPQSILDALVGSISFDPSAFNRMSGAKQREVLKTLDPNLDFSSLDDSRSKLYDERTTINRQAKEAGAITLSIDFDPNAPEEPVDIAALTVELERRLDINSKNTESRQKLLGLSHRMDEIVAKAEVLRKELQASESVIESTKLRIKDQSNVVDSLKDADDDEVRQKIASAQSVNDVVLRNKERAVAMKKSKELADRSEAITQEIEEIDVKKRDAIENADLPIKGLGFDDDGVTFGGVPFNQASQSEQWRASIAIGAAMNPRLSVMLVREGALLDDERLKMVAEMAEDSGVQLWIEDVGTGRSSVVIEDGSVRAEKKTGQ